LAELPRGLAPGKPESTLARRRRPRTPNLTISHWCKLVENLQASPLEFYAAVEQAIEQRQIPEAERSRIDYQEGGLLSAKREYLRVERREHLIDICGAPFGNGFFFSSWLGAAPPAVDPFHVLLVVLGMMTIAYGFVKLFGLILGGLLLLMSLGALIILLRVARSGTLPFSGDVDAALVSIPIVGPVYERFFRPMTYYRIDTALMFQQAVHAAVLEVIDQMTSAKGLRALSEDERKPILREFYRR
jgi:hypothetical protein